MSAAEQAMKAARYTMPDGSTGEVPNCPWGGVPMEGPIVEGTDSWWKCVCPPRSGGGVGP